MENNNGTNINNQNTTNNNSENNGNIKQTANNLFYSIKINDIYRNVIYPFRMHKTTYNDSNILMATMIGNPYCLDLETSIPISENTIKAINNYPSIKNSFNKMCADSNNSPSYEDIVNFIVQTTNDDRLSSTEKFEVLQNLETDINKKQNTRQTIGSILGWSTTILGTGSTIVYLLANPQIFALFTISPVLQWVLLGITIASAVYLATTRIVNLVKSAKAQSDDKVNNIDQKITQANKHLQQQMQQEIANTNINAFNKFKKTTQGKNVPIVQNRIHIPATQDLNNQTNIPVQQNNLYIPAIKKLNDPQQNNNINKHMPTIGNNLNQPRHQESFIIQSTEKKKDNLNQEQQEENITKPNAKNTTIKRKGILKDKNHIKNVNNHVKWKEPIKEEYVIQNNNLINLENNNNQKTKTTI